MNRVFAGLISSSRMSAYALVAIASLLPAATGCSSQQTWAPQPSDKTLGQAATQVTPPPTPAGIPTSQNTFDATGQAYYTINDDGTTTTVQGYFLDGAAGSTVTLGGDGSVLTADLQDRGLPVQHLVLSVDPSASGTGISGTLGSDAFTLQVDASGNVTGGPSSYGSSPNTGAIMLAFDMFSSSSGQRRAWACTVCVGAAIAIVAAIYLLIQSGLGAALIGNLVNAYRIFGLQGVMAILRNQAANLSVATRTAVISAITALAGAGVYVVNKCIECYTGEAVAAANTTDLSGSQLASAGSDSGSASGSGSGSGFGSGSGSATAATAFGH